MISTNTGRRENKVHAGFHPITATIPAVPRYLSAIGIALKKQVTRRIGNLHQTILHQSCHRYPTFIIGSHRIGKSVYITIIVGRLYSIGPISSQAAGRSYISHTRYRIDDYFGYMIRRQFTVLCRKVVQNLRPVGTYQIQSRFSGSYPLTIGAIYEYVGNIDIL